MNLLYYILMYVHQSRYYKYRQRGFINLACRESRSTLRSAWREGAPGSSAHVNTRDRRATADSLPVLSRALGLPLCRRPTRRSAAAATYSPKLPGRAPGRANAAQQIVPGSKLVASSLAEANTSSDQPRLHPETPALAPTARSTEPPTAPNHSNRV